MPRLVPYQERSLVPAVGILAEVEKGSKDNFVMTQMGLFFLKIFKQR